MRRTEEQEAYRISRVQAALKGRPATEKQRNARAEGLRKAWAEGRVKCNFTPEVRKKIGDKLRGRKRPQHVIDAIVKAHTGKKKSPEQCGKLRVSSIAKCTHKHLQTPEAIAKRIQGFRAYIKTITGDLLSPESRASQAAKMRGRKAEPEHVEKRVKKLRGREQSHKLTMKGPTNQCSKEAWVRDASGRLWFIRNISHFVRTHKDLFKPEDLIPIYIKGRSLMSPTCNAVKRIGSLFHAKPLATWKGWTAATSIPEKKDGYGDLLGRDKSAVPNAA